MNQVTKIFNAFRRVRVPIPRFGHGLLLAVLLSVLGVSLLAPQRGEEEMPNFRPLKIAQRKLDFFGFLRPIVASVNARIARQKVRLQSVVARIREGAKLSWSDRRWIRKLSRQYKVPIGDAGVTHKVIKALLLRVDVVPEPLVLVQAAKESGWGTSRFAVQGNNLFGQRCYSPGCGIAPKKSENDRFGLAEFDSVRDSVASYIKNLNTHPQYRAFRKLRKRLRNDDRPLNPLVLVEGLDDYSERGQQYVSELKALIRQNRGVEDD